MRKTMIELLDQADKLRKILNVSSYEVHDYETDGQVEFKVRNLKLNESVVNCLNGWVVNIFGDDGNVVIRINEKIETNQP